MVAKWASTLSVVRTCRDSDGEWVGLSLSMRNRNSAVIKNREIQIMTVTIGNHDASPSGGLVCGLRNHGPADVDRSVKRSIDGLDRFNNRFRLINFLLSKRQIKKI